MKKTPFKDFEFSMFRKSDYPVYIRSAGHFLLDEPDRSSWHETASFCELFWCIEGRGRFELNGESFLLHPDEVWFYPEGHPHHFEPADKFFHYRWFTMEGSLAPALFAAVGIAPGISYGGPCPEELFARLEMLIRKSSSTARLEQLSAGFQILCHAAAGIRLKKKAYDYVQEAKEIIDRDFSKLELSIKSLAQILHVNRVQLSREFSHQYGIPISAYLRKLRMQKGMELLSRTPLPVEEVARSCGYNSADYFGKVITKITGENPTKYRVFKKAEKQRLRGKRRSIEKVTARLQN